MSRIETQQRKKTSIPVYLIGLTLSILVISTSLYLLLYPFPSSERINYFNLNHPIIYNEQLYGPAIIRAIEVFLPLAFVQEHIDESLIFDDTSSSVILTTRNKVVQMPADSLTYFVNEQPTQLEIPAMISNNGDVFLSFSTIKAYYPFKITLLDTTGAVLIQKDGDTVVKGVIQTAKNEHENRLRAQPEMTSPYVVEVKKDEVVTIEKEEHGYYYIRNEDGIAGFIQKKQVILDGTDTVIVMTEEYKRFSPTVKWPINLTWEAVYTKNPDTTKLPVLTGVNVVSPTWFKIKNEQGEIQNLGSMEYMNWAKSQNLHVWGLFSNDFNPELTHEVLQSYETRMNMIRQLLQYSQMYGLDGINIDFENVKLDDGKLITQFVSELTPYLHQAGLTVSMDITFISSSPMWSKFYEREKLAGIVDYMIVMAYDEHWATSPASGSVASFPWVKSNLEALLKVVPHDRLILGLPTYTRIWKEQETASGNIEVSSKAYSMNYIKEWLTNHQLEPKWDVESEQFYAQYRDELEKATYKVWIEDEESLARRSQLVHHYQLAGVATWSRFFASDEAWGAVDESLKQRK